MADIVSKEQIYSWLHTFLQNEDIEDYTCKLSGSSETVGYTGDIIFVHVQGKKKSNNEDVHYHLAMKVSKNLKDYLDVYRRESFVYNKIFPALKEFQIQRQVKEPFDAVPKCYKTITDGRDILILDNLKEKGYVAHDRATPMNIPHIQLVLRNYAKFHAISFAFKDQNPVEFKNLLKDYTDVFYNMMMDSMLTPLYQPTATGKYELIKGVDKELAAKLNEKLIQKGIVNVLKPLLKDPPKESVVRHGDCWNSNFLFKYNGNDHEQPTDVAIIDWQMSNYHSPAIDLSYFMFSVSSQDQVSHFDELLKYYHDNLCYFISEMGSNPEELFPLSTFLEHWKKYSVYGLTFLLSFLEFTMSFTVDSLELDDDKEKLLDAVMNTSVKSPNLILDRALCLSKYYFQLIDE